MWGGATSKDDGDDHEDEDEVGDEDEDDDNGYDDVEDGEDGADGEDDDDYDDDDDDADDDDDDGAGGDDDEDGVVVWSCGHVDRNWSSAKESLEFLAFRVGMGLFLFASTELAYPMCLKVMLRSNLCVVKNRQKAWKFADRYLPGRQCIPR